MEDTAQKRVAAAMAKAALWGVQSLDARELMIYQWIQNGGSCASCGR